MAVTNGWGQGVENNTIEWGKGSTNNSNNWGSVYGSSAAGDTLLSAASFSNTHSTEYDGVDQYCKTNSTYSELDGINNFAFSFWIKPTSINGKMVFGIGNSAADTRAQQFQAFFSANKLLLYLNNLSTHFRTPANALVVDQWQHVLITRDAARAVGDKGRIYVNGVNSVESDNTRYWTNTTNATKELYIGEHTEGYQAPFLGHIDEFAIYDQDMAAYISEIYDSSGAVDLNNLATAPAPTSWYRFEEGSGTTLTDSGTSGNNGTLINGTTFSTDVPT